MEAGADKPNRGKVQVPAGMNVAWRIFCRPGTTFVEHYACRGTRLIEASNLSRFIVILLRADARIRVQQILRIYLEGRSTCLPAGRKAKSVTNNLPILSVLLLVLCYLSG